MVLKMDKVITFYYPLVYGQNYREAQWFFDEIIIDLAETREDDYPKPFGGDVRLLDMAPEEPMPEDYMCYNAVRVDITLDEKCSVIKRNSAFTMVSTEELTTQALTLVDERKLEITDIQTMWVQVLKCRFSVKLLCYLEDIGQTVDIEENEEDNARWIYKDLMQYFRDGAPMSKLYLRRWVNHLLDDYVVCEGGKIPGCRSQGEPNLQHAYAGTFCDLIDTTRTDDFLFFPFRLK